MNSGIVGDTNINITNSSTNIDSIQQQQDEVDYRIEMALASGQYKLSDPYLIQDPYGRAPLTALVAFETDEYCEITVFIEPKGEYGTVEYQVPTDGTTHLVPIIGMYADYLNKVTITAIDKNGNSESKLLDIQTGELPNNMAKLELQSLDLPIDDEHFTQIGYSSGFTSIVDMNGEVRWHYGKSTNMNFSYKDDGHIILQNNLASGIGNENINTTATLTEIDILGKIYLNYNVNDRMHHEHRYIGNNLLAYTSNNEHNTGMDDAITIINLEDGSIYEHINLNPLLDRYRYYIDYRDGKEDWFHANSLDYDSIRDTFVISGRTHGVVELNENRELEWILSPNVKWGDKYEQYLLTPVDKNGTPLYNFDNQDELDEANRNFFPWTQHAIEYAPDLDNNPDTLEIILFNNHDIMNGYLDVVRGDYSEGIVYSINKKDMTVEILWRFGQELGSDFWSYMFSDNNYISNGNFLLTSGATTKIDNYNAHIIETDFESNILWSLTADQYIWIAEEVPIYPEGYKFELGSDVKNHSVIVKQILEEIPYPAEYEVIDFYSDSIDLMPQLNNKIVVSGKFTNFVFDRQLGYLTLFDGNGNSDVYGFLIQNNNYVLDDIDIMDKDYVAYQISVVDEQAEVVYQSEKQYKHLTYESPLESYLIPHTSNTQLSSIGSIALNEDAEQLSIAGWTMITGINSDKNTKISIILNGENSNWKYEVPAIVTRADVTNVHGKNEFNYDYSGFNTAIQLSDLPSDTYTVGLEVITDGKVAYKDTSHYFEIIAEETGETENTDIITRQEVVSTRLSNTLDSGDYSLQNPYIEVNPYDISPLTALALFNTDKPATVTIEVNGLRGAETISNNFEEVTTEHIVPIYALYSKEATDVTITVNYTDGTSESNTISVTGGSLPSKLITGEAIYSEPSSMAYGLTFISAISDNSCAYAVDANGEIRWVYDDPGGLSRTFPIILLENGNLMSTISDGTTSYYKYGVQEFDLTGKVYKEFMLNGTQHDVVEMPSGNLLVLGDDISGNVIEDSIYEIDRETGEIVRSWDMDSYFDVANINENGEHISGELHGSGARDWFHNNSLDYYEADNSVVISGRNQDSVVKIDLDTGELVWVFSDPKGLWTPYLEERLLTPVGDDFEYFYGQHNIQVLDNGDLLIFDNGLYRAKTEEDILPVNDGYSRVVRYRVDEQNGTVEQIWQYGKEHGGELLSRFVSGAQHLDDNHYLAHFGGIVRDGDGNPSYEYAVSLDKASSHTHVVEIVDDNVVFEYVVDSEGENTDGNSYRSVRMSPYTNTSYPSLDTGTRVGKLINYGSVLTASHVPTISKTSLDEAVETFDNGITLNLTNLPIGDNLTLYLDGDTTCKVELAVSNSQSSIVAGEVPVGTYKLYLEVDGICYDLNLSWINTQTTMSVPVRYEVIVDTSNEVMGTAYGTGLYYPSTALTVTAMPNDGYNFTGWSMNGEIVNNDISYNFIPTKNVNLVATFTPVE